MLPLFRKNVRNEGGLDIESTQIIYNVGGGGADQETLYNRNGADLAFKYIGSRINTDVFDRYGVTVRGNQIWSDGVGGVNVVSLEYKGSGSEMLLVDSTGVARATLDLGKITSLNQSSSGARVFEVAMPSDTSRRLYATAGGKFGFGTGTTG